ncbi:MAG TPA: alanyl-tRNA editing protein [Spirochaetia bacterium]|nr:alanyl-tRNA editing protein [Spirochaetia bacterium]
MTEKLYYQDPSLLEFDASIQEHRADGTLHEVVLDRTCFFPGGGGQPADRGLLGEARVVDVKERDNEIVHVVDAALGSAGTLVHGAVDAARRQDFMAQHTGQHVLSEALLKVAGLATVSVHFGDETTTIELETPGVSDKIISGAEELANSVIRENRQIRIHDIDPKDVGRFPLRRAPPEVGRLRIVEVDSYDWAACSGLHVASSAQIGLIKIVSQEKIRGRARIHTLIGRRAIEDYGRKVSLVQSLTRLLTCGEADIPTRVEELVRSARENEKELGRLRLVSAVADADASIQHAKVLGDVLLIRKDLEGAGPAYLKAFTERVVASPGRVVVTVDRTGDGFQWIVAHSIGARVELPVVIKPIIASTGVRGGGRGAWMQGAGASADGAPQFAGAVEEALARLLR